MSDLPEMQAEQGGPDESFTAQMARDKRGRWTPGMSGNPNGRPAVSLLREIRRELERQSAKPEESRLQVIAREYVDWLVANANPGNMHLVAGAIRDLIDRLDGRALERISTKADEPVGLIIVSPGAEEQSG